MHLKSIFHASMFFKISTVFFFPSLEFFQCSRKLRKFFPYAGHGGGWGYSGYSIEAVRFMCDTDVLIGGFGLFGGRGEYMGKIKVRSQCH